MIERDSSCYRSYAAAMESGAPHIVLKLDTSQPIELGDFVSAFTALSKQYERFIREEHPELSSDATMYVREVRAGCIEADLIPWLSATGLPALIGVMDQILIVDQFVRRYGIKLQTYFTGGKVEDASKSDLNEFMGQVAAIANDPEGKSSISSAHYEDGRKEQSVVITFDTGSAKTAMTKLEEHKKELDAVEGSDYSRELMYYRRSDTDSTDVGKRSGELVIIEKISDKAKPLIYASGLAEQRIKDEIRNSKDNIYKKGFVVDVNVRTRGGKLAAYAVTHVHQVIDLSDDDDDES